VWTALGKRLRASWQQHARVSWLELEGMVNSGVPLGDLLRLGCDFEMQMLSYADGSLLEGPACNVSTAADSAGHCTAFTVTAGGRCLCGQNVDEAPEGWLDGAKDVVLRLQSSDGVRRDCGVCVTDRCCAGSP